MADKKENLEQLTPAQRALLAVKEMRGKLEAMERAKSEPIAVIGIGCRFPGAHGPQAYWDLLAAGRDAVSEVPPERWDIDEYYDPNPEAPGKMYVRHGGFVEHVDKFDPAFFGVSPREAAGMDPQQRMLMETAWEALEHGNIVPATLHGSLTGVFVGISTSDYLHAQTHHAEKTGIDAYFGTGNAFSVACGRLSYTLGLQGPSLAVDTACSSSLVAVHLACQSLRNGETQLALAGGVNAMVTPGMTINFCKARMLAPDGRCKTFDESADGYVRGEGCGFVVLKRLSDAERDGDRIYALIRGSAVNQDGKSNGLTAPNGPAQEAVIQQALASAKVAAHEVSYVEAHGTGTSLGDPIEMRALGEVMRVGREHPLYVASAKTNFGHLEAAAGIAGLIKVVLALHHAAIPPHLHFKKLSPHIAIDHIPAIIPTQLVPFPEINSKRFAGLSSFGFSGTNAHLILQGANEDKKEKEPSLSLPLAPCSLLTLSAKNAESLRALAQRYAESSAFDAHTLAEVCFTANTKRTHFEQRLAVLAESSAHAKEKLAAFAAGKPSSALITGVAKNAAVRPKIAFLFTGQGAQYLDMGKQLYETQPVFRETLDKCDALLRAHLAVPLLEVISDQLSVNSHQSLNTDNCSLVTDHWLHQTAYTQPALFAIEYALAELWKSWGIEPSIVLGHSVGEYAAACVAGMFSLEDGLKLIAARARLMQALPQNGAMAAIFAHEEKVAAALRGYEDRVSIAAINDPSNIVISGEKSAVEAIVQKFEAAGVKSKALTVSHAFHSPLMEPMLDAFEKVVSEITFHAPKIPLISNLTAQPLQLAVDSDQFAASSIQHPATSNQQPASSNQQPATIHDPRSYFRRHLRETVRFADSMRTLHEQGYKIFVEIGPHPTLLSMGMKCLPEGYGQWLPSLRKGQDDALQMLKSLAGLHVHGVEVDWENFHREESRVAVSLPTYAFKRERFWFEESPGRKTKSAADALTDWLYEITWQEQPRRAEQVAQTSYLQAKMPALLLAPETFPLSSSATWLIFVERAQLRNQLAQELEQHGARGILVFAGAEFQQMPDGHFHLNPTRAEDYERLLQHCAENNIALAGVVHAWSLETEAKASLGGLEAAHDLSTGSALLLAQALHKTQLASKPRVWFVTRGAQAVGNSPLDGGQGGVGEDVKKMGTIAASNDTPLNPPSRGDSHWQAHSNNSPLEGGQEGVANGVKKMSVVTASDDTPLNPPSRGDSHYSPLKGGINLAQAPLWGFARVLALEHPELWGGIIDLGLLSNPNEAAQILAELHDAEGEDQIALREDKRFVARLIPNKQIETKPVAIHHEASYLITGGLGNLGLRVARWLVAKGARHLVLTGRTGLPTREAWDETASQEKFHNAINTIREMEKLGATIHIAKVDVSEPHALAQAWRELPNDLPPLRGIVHAAGISQPTPIQKMSRASLREVLRPKVAGTWLLHEFAQNFELDFFACYSSISAIWGSQGLAHYAAANHFLDGFAHYRRAMGLPAISLNWAQWQGESMASHEAQANLERMGLYSLAPEHGMAAFEALVSSHAVQRVIANVDWSKFKPVLEVRGRRPLLEHVHAASLSNEQNTSAEKSELLRALEEAVASEREEILVRFVSEQAANVLGLAASAIDPQKPLAEMGLDSLMAVELRNALALAVGKTLPSTLLFDFPTLEALCHYLLKETLSFDEDQAAAPTNERVITHDEPIAIIGMACRFPGGANSPEAFWRMLHEGVDAITEVPSTRWDLKKYYDADPEAPGKMYCRFGGFIDQAEAFDPQFFGIAPREAQTMDPQQLLLLEVAWEAFEHAGIAPDKLSGSRTGVFLGMSSFEHTLLQAQHGDAAQADSFSGTSGGYSYAAGRLSYSFGLQGPCMTLDTACSSSLVAAHLACQSLRNGESNMALVAGVNVLLSPAWQVNVCKARMLAVDGRCKTFDESADGFVRSDGCGVVLLKRLSDALADGDNVLALIRGSAVNQDGKSSGMTAPNGPAQEAVIRAALASANVSPQEVSFVEAHGTGTALGDAIEVRALSNVMSAHRKENEPLFIGTVKTNIGHLEAASGVAGLIKLVLALQAREIPQHLHFKKINLQIALDDWRMKIPAERTAWPAYNNRRIAGLSAFGLSGTNAHLVLQGANDDKKEKEPSGEEKSEERRAQLLTLSAKGENALKELAARYEHYLAQHSVPATAWPLHQNSSLVNDSETLGPAEGGARFDLANFCFTANSGRSHFSHRLALPVANVEHARAALAAFVAGEETPALISNKLESFNRLKLGFLFASHGAYLGMGKRLFATQSVFRRTFEQCDEALREPLQASLCEVLYAEDAAKKFPASTIRLCAQPALFALEVSLAEMWKSWGVAPSVVLGHETGEYAAAVVAGVMSIAEALGLLALRARWNEARVQKTQSEMERWQQEFEQRTHAVRYQTPRLTAIASLTGKIAKKGELTLPNYWSSHLQTSPDLTEAFKTAYKQSVDFFIEIGPTSMLNDTLRASLPKQDANWLPSLMKQKDEWEIALGTLGKLYAHGAEVNWRGLHAGEMQRRLVLPTYPFQREVQLQRIEEESGAQHVTHGKKSEIAEWFYAPSWKRTPLPAARTRNAVFQTASAGGDACATALAETPSECWLLFADAQGLAEELGKRLEREGHSVVHVVAGEAFAQTSAHRFSIRPSCRADYETLVQELNAKGFVPSAVVHAWSLNCQEKCSNLGLGEVSDLVVHEGEGSNATAKPLREHMEKCSNLGLAEGSGFVVHEREDLNATAEPLQEHLCKNFNSLLFLAQALEQKREGAPLRFEILTHRLYDVIGESARYWENAPLLALSKVLPQEFEGVSCRVIDIESIPPLIGARGVSSDNVNEVVFVDEQKAQRELDEVSDAKHTPRTPLKGGIVGEVIPDVIPPLREARGVSSDNVNTTEFVDEQKTWRELDEVSDAKHTPLKGGVVEQLVRELASPHEERVVAYRGAHRWALNFEPVRLEEANDNSTRLREGGVYVILGGLGRLGCAIAEMLASTVRAKLVLVNRTPLPPREQWRQWRDNHLATDEISLRIARAQRLEELGAEILLFHADITDYEHMQAALATAQTRFGKIHGVLHAAGVRCEKALLPLQHMNAETTTLLAQRATSLMVLENVLREHELDFCFLLSALASVLGGKGAGILAAEGLLNEAFAQRMNETSATPWLHVSSEAWRLEESARALLMPEFAMTREEGATAFQRMLASESAALVISTGDLNARVTHWIRNGGRDHAKSKANVLHERPNLATPFVAPQNQTEKTLAEIWQGLLGLKSVGVNDNFFELGGSSLLGVSMFANIEKQFDKKLPLNLLMQAPTVAQLATLLNQGDATAKWAPLVLIQPNGTKPPLYCVHPGVGTVLGFNDLAAQLGAEQPFYGIQARGLDGKEKPFSRIEPMAAYYIREIKNVQPQGPYLLSGRCFGGLVAYEMAQQLHAAGERVALLAIIDTVAMPNVELEERAFLEGKVVKVHSTEESEEMGEKWRESLMEIYGPVFRHVGKKHDTARKRYVPQPYAGRVTLFRNGNEEETPEHELKWQKLALGGLEVHAVPGDHKTILLEPHVSVLAQRLRACIEAALAE